jgi:hypothetical protein
MKTPVILITFIRPNSTAQILNILNKNKIKNLFVFNDGPRLKTDDKAKILETRSIIDNFKFNGNIFKIYEKNNIGLANNIPKAIDQVFKNFNKAIILECDTIPSDDFFAFCDELLIRYENDMRISQISGTNFLNYKSFKRRNNDSYFFSKFTPCWGWATWKNRWNGTYEKNMSTWPTIKKEKWLMDFFGNKKDSNYWENILNRRYLKIDHDWDRIWTYVNLINNRISICPSKNLITNIGHDSVAAHKQNPKKWNAIKIEKMHFPLKHPIVISADKEVDNFLIKEGISKPKLLYRIKIFLKKLIKKNL